MNKEEFADAAFRIARKRDLDIDQGRDGRMRIWFNPKSKKYLWRDQIEALHPLLLQKDLTKGQVSARIQEIAPGKPCTHKGMREIAEEIRAEIANRPA